MTKWPSLVMLTLSACAWNCALSRVIVSNRFEKRLQNTTSQNRSQATRAVGSWSWSWLSDIRQKEIGSANPFCHPITFRDRFTDLQNVAGNCLHELVFDDCCQPRYLQLTRTGVYPIEYAKHGYGYCDMTTDGGGWIVVARRSGGRRSFDKTWKQFKRGFGPIDRDFWIGLDSLFRLTRFTTEMRIDFVHENGSQFYAHYNYFSVGQESINYKLTIEGYNPSKSNIFDAFSEHNGASFSTKDRNNLEDQTSSCRNVMTLRGDGGWWYLSNKPYCFRVNLNSEYYMDEAQTMARGIPWYSTERDPTSTSGEEYFRFVEMKLRPKSWVCGHVDLDWDQIQRLFLERDSQADEEAAELETTTDGSGTDHIPSSATTTATTPSEPEP